MIFNSSKNKDPEDTTKSVIVECECSTHNMKITSYEEESQIYISMFTDNFYWKQDGIFKTLFGRIATAWKMLIGKQYLLEQVIVDKSDVDKIIKALKSMK